MPLLEASLASAYFSDLICVHPAPTPQPSDTLALSGFLKRIGILLPGLLHPTLEGRLLPSGFSSGAPKPATQVYFLHSTQHNRKHHLITRWIAASASVESKFHYSKNLVSPVLCTCPGRHTPVVVVNKYLPIAQRMKQRMNKYLFSHLMEGWADG